MKLQQFSYTIVSQATSQAGSQRQSEALQSEALYLCTQRSRLLQLVKAANTGWTIAELFVGKPRVGVALVFCGSSLCSIFDIPQIVRRQNRVILARS